MRIVARRFFIFPIATFLLPPLFLLTACDRPLEKSTHHWFAMDTDFSATLFVKRPGKVPQDRAFARLERESARLEALFSDYMPGSALAKLQGRKGDTLRTDPEIMTVFRAALEMSQASRGRFDITLHNLKSAWGLASGEANRIPTGPELAEAMRGNPAFGAPADSNPALRPAFEPLPDDRLLLLRDSAVFDLGGIAKGYAVDRMHAILDSLGYPDHIVMAGGDLRAGGSKPGKPWVLGIRHPRQSDGLAGTLTLPGPSAVSTSGDYERYFIKDGVRYHHIFDPRTGRPARPYCSVSVLAANSMLADRLTKPLFLAGPVEGAGLLERFGAKAVWMREAGEASHLCYVASEGMAGILEMKDIPPCPDGK